MINNVDAITEEIYTGTTKGTAALWEHFNKQASTNEDYI